MMRVTLKPKKCAICKSVFTPIRSTERVCSVPCAIAWSDRAKAKKAVQAQRAERKRLREGKTKLKPRSAWIREAQAAVNKVARLRDIRAGYGCISCGSRPEQRYGGSVDGGHFRSVGSAAHMRFYLPNIRLQCKKCNQQLGGAHTNYRVGLIERIGIERVEEIESMQWTAKWSIEYLQRLKRIMNKKARRLERRIAMDREAA
ncbi:recombination protein NinG [Burkholderia glumae]|uniref:recombination protein NinG n=1 Tax=Burkholderia glumae TaxID=337 RepID=UPI0020374717|nr:recombination protein NinG [Burkholderia glumae]MCM2546177.1 recombination protein NinG [Burkholderia glumae]